MPDITQICTAVNFIEGHLKEAITVADIADAAGYSLYHFCRSFNEATHHPPYDYLMRRRLSESARDLAKTDRKIIDIAFDYQFNNHETYSRAFKRMFDMQPSQVKKQGSVDSRYLMHPITPAHLEQINKGNYLRPLLREEVPFQITGVMGLIKAYPTGVEVLWKLLHEEIQRSHVEASIEDTYGILYYPQRWQSQGILYMAATEIPQPDAASPALVCKTIPALTCARFIHKGPNKTIQLTLDYIYHTWLPKSGNTLSYPLVIERYRQGFKRANHPKGEIEIYIPIQ